jgi:hypothetical protein
MPRKQTSRRFVLCVNNEGYAASLEARKIYVSIPDKAAKSHGYVRVIDESGEDYLYSEDRFVEIEVPREARSAFVRVA